MDAEEAVLRGRLLLSGVRLFRAGNGPGSGWVHVRIIVCEQEGPKRFRFGPSACWLADFAEWSRMVGKYPF